MTWGHFFWVIVSIAVRTLAHQQKHPSNCALARLHASLCAESRHWRVNTVGANSIREASVDMEIDYFWDAVTGTCLAELTRLGMLRFNTRSTLKPAS